MFPKLWEKGLPSMQCAVAISVIIPCYNGARVLRSSIFALADYLNSLGQSWEIIVVDDGSTDGTGQIVEQAAEQLGRSRVWAIRHKVTCGKGRSVRDGMLAAGGKYRVFVDVDLDYGPSEIGKILARLEAGADVAVASRVASGASMTLSPWHLQYMYTRHLMSRLLNKVFRNFFVRGITDSQAGLKGFTAKAAEAVFSRTMVDGFSFDIEVLCIARHLGLAIEEVPVHCVYGQQPSTVEFTRAGLGLVRDMIMTKVNLARGVYDLDPLSDKQPLRQRYLVVTADDYGLSQWADRGIICGAQAGAISSISVLASERLKPWPGGIDHNIGFGLHINLTEGRPASGTDGLKPILTSQGQFCGLARLVLQCARRALSIKHLTEEILAQADRLVRAGYVLDHIDGHEHVQHLPCVREAVVEAACQLGIRWVRVSCERLGYEIAAWPCTAKKLALMPFLASTRRFFQSCGLRSADRFFGIALVQPQNFESAFTRAIQESSQGVNEIVLHLAEGQVDQEDRLGVWRYKSLESLIGYDLSASAENAGLIVTRFADIRLDDNTVSEELLEDC